MSPAAGPVISPSHKSPSLVPFSSSFTNTESLSGSQKDAVIEWYRGEFAAANAIIDALCQHIVEITTLDTNHVVPVEYECVFGAIHRRRLNWIPVLQTQKYFSVADVANELRKAVPTLVTTEGEKVESSENDQKDNSCVSEGEGSPESDITDTGSHELQAFLDPSEVCDNHENCAFRREQIKLTKGFVAKEPVKGHMVNVAKGLKMFEDVFTVTELTKLQNFVDELRATGQNGDLLGETYILFNKEVKTNKREQIQLGVPLFGHVKDEANNEEQKANNEPIPELVQSVIDHLVQWQVLPENRKPNGCIINYFDEDEHSQPFLKPPHLDQPLCTLVLSESTIAFGRTLINDGEGNFKGQLMLSMKQGSVLVMRNNSADVARHAMCASPTKRVSLTFTRVRPDHLHTQHSTPFTPLNQAMTLWQPAGMQNLQIPQNRAAIDLIPKWGVLRTPLVMLAPVPPLTVNPRRMPHGGTGVFLPWTVGSRKPARHLPPRAQKGRFLKYHTDEKKLADSISDPGFEGRVM